MLTAALTILGKDLRLRMRDRSVLLFAVVVPLGLTVLFALVLPTDGDLEVSAAVVDEDGGEVAAGFVEQVVPALVDVGLVELSDTDDRDAATRAMDDGDLDAVWILPEGLTESVNAGRGGRLEVLVNPDRGLSAEVARSVASTYAANIEAVTLAVATATTAAGEQATDDLVAEIAHAATTSEPGLALRDESARDRQLEGTSYLSAGMAAFFVFFTVQFGVTGLLEERQLGTLSRLLASPVPLAAVHVGKLLGALLLGLVSMAVLAVASALLLDADWGPPGGVAVLIVAIVISALGLMALVGSFARTAEQAGNLQSIVAVVVGMVGGVFFPLPLDTGLLRVVMTLSPHAWFLRGLGDVAADGSWTAALPAAGALVALGAAAALPAALRLRRAPTW